MLPTVVANELRETVQEFLRNAFPFATPYFQRQEDGASATAIIDRLLADPTALFQRPLPRPCYQRRHFVGIPPI